MKKLLLFTAVVFICNAAIEFLAYVGIVSGAFGGKPVILTVAALLALPGLVIQPWYIYILLFARPSNFWLSPLYATAITVPLCVLLNRYGVFDGDKRWWAKLNHRKVIMYTIGSIVLAVGLGYGSWVDFPPIHKGIPPELRVSGKPFPIPVSNSRYYCLSRFIDTEWLWQARMSGADVDRLAKMEGMRPLKRERIGRAFYHMPPYWWHPVVTDSTKVLSTPGFPMNDRGQDGDHWLATWNPDDQVIHIWVKFNF